jgi:hypothetical protein
MLPLDEVISQLIVSAAMDDVSFPIVLNALRDLDRLPPGADDTECMLNFVSLLLDHGFMAVTNPYADPPSTPWPEQARGKAAILQRIRREWEALDHEVTFLDLCWFHRPGDMAENPGDT